MLVFAMALLGMAARADAVEGPGPTCADGPAEVGRTIEGTPCDDTIVVPSDVAVVDGGGGDDVIVPAPIAAAESCPLGCFLDIGSQTFEGGPGNDIVYGERGNDRLFGGRGSDQLFGGIGDDLLLGGSDADRLLGGFGHDSIDGEAGDDYVRGDATVDEIVDRGGGVDTLSYSTGITPGFFNNHSFDPDASDGLPPLGGERGVYLDLSASPESENGDNGVAPFGGGIDKVEGADFEIVIGTPFSDYIVGTGDPETFYGGGGGDVIFGGDGADSLHGGADGDHLDGGGGTDGADGGPGSDHCSSATATACEPANDGGVVPRDPTKVVAGQLADGSKYAHLYLVGSSTADEVVAAYSAGGVTFTLGPGSTATFDTGPAAATGCNTPSGGQLVCPLSKQLDSLVLAGLGGADKLSVSGFPDAVGIVIAGGEGGDTITGREGEDILADGPDANGPGDDVLSALGGDDALLNNDGFDQLSGGTGNDLFLSDSICDGDAIDGGGERDNASWTKFDSAVAVRLLAPSQAGEPGPGGEPQCGTGSIGTLSSIEDLEGTVAGDIFVGDDADNQLLGWAGPDTYSAGPGADRILANSGDSDPLVSCGDDTDVLALIDRPPHVDVVADDCENVREGDVNNFRVETELEVPPQPPPPEPVQPVQEEVKSPPGDRPRAPCLARARRGPLSCAVRPARLSFAPLGTVKRVRWTHWGGKRAIGFGRLVAARCCNLNGAARAKVRATRLESCDGRGWYTRLTVTYGRAYGKAFLRRAISATPCG